MIICYYCPPDSEYYKKLYDSVMIITFTLLAKKQFFKTRQITQTPKKLPKDKKGKNGVNLSVVDSDQLLGAARIGKVVKIHFLTFHFDFFSVIFHPRQEKTRENSCFELLFKAVGHGG